MKEFTQIKNQVIFNPKISNGAFRVYVALRSYQYGKSRVFPSEETLASRLQVSTRTIITHLKALKKVGLIDYKRRGYSASNIYTFTNEETFTNDVTTQENINTSITKETSFHLSNYLQLNNTNNNIENNNMVFNQEERERGLESIRDALIRMGLKPSTDKEKA